METIVKTFIDGVIYIGVMLLAVIVFGIGVMLLLGAMILAVTGLFNHPIITIIALIFIFGWLSKF